MIELHREKNRFLRGKAIFTDDIAPEDLIHCLAVRSRVPNGEIKSILAQTLPAGYNLVNHAMIPGKNSIQFPDCEAPCLADKDVSYVGEPILLLAGPQMRVLEDLESKIDIRYGLKQPVYSVDDVHVTKSLEYRFERGDVAKAFSAPQSVILTKTYTTGCQEHAASETQSAIAQWNVEKNNIVLYVASTHPFHVRASVARVLGLPEKAVRVIVPDTSDSLGGKMYYPSVIACHAAIVSFLTGKPCKIVFSRYEELLFSFKRHPAKISLSTASDNKGKITGLKASIVLDCGAYKVNPRIEIERMMITLLSTYECENVEIAGFAALTNKVPSGPFEGLGEPQAVFALEMHATSVAKGAQSDPYQWRKENAREILKSGHKNVRESERTLAVLDEVVQKSDFVRKHAAYEALTKRSKKQLSPNLFLRGIGLAFSVHGNGRPGAIEQEDANHFCKLVFENKTLRIITSFVDSGSSKETFFALIASRVLGISTVDVFLEHVDTGSSPYSGPQTCARTVSILGKAIEQAAHVLAQKIAKGASEAEVTKKIVIQAKPRESESSFDEEAYHSYATEGTVVEVEISPTTLQVYCRGIWIVMDPGLVLSQEMARREVETAAIQNLGYASTELLTFEIGRIEQKTLSEYNIPGIKDHPRINVVFHQGEKGKRATIPSGLGDQAVTCVAPAYVAAIVQAFGREYTSIPLYAELMDEQGI